MKDLPFPCGKTSCTSFSLHPGQFHDGTLLHAEMACSETRIIKLDFGDACSENRMIKLDCGDVCSENTGLYAELVRKEKKGQE